MWTTTIDQDALFGRKTYNLLRNRKDYYYVNDEKARKLLGISLGLGEDGFQAPLPWFGFGLFLGASEAPFDFFDFEFCFFYNFYQFWNPELFLAASYFNHAL